MNKEDNILRFYLLATSLKNKIRQGSIYWNVSAQRLESVAEHIYDTCMLAIAVHSEYNISVDISKVILMLTIHELEEIFIGDITPFDSVTDQDKLTMGKLAVKNVLSSLNLKEDYILLTDEFNAQNTDEAKFAYLCDKLDFDIQMKLYEDKGQLHLQKDSNTPVYKNQTVKTLISAGLSKPTEIFYAFDHNKYADSPEFKALLDYAYSIDLAKFLDKN